MRFITTTGIGGPDVMRLEQGFAPQIGPHDLLIEVYAAGVNRPDLMQRAGFYPPPPDASPSMGLEVAGVVAAVGDDIIDWHPGDRVCGLTNGGGYAEYVAVPVGQCLPIPGKLTFDEAAALPETFFTVWANVFERAQLQPNETFLVHGGSGGIGSAAIQMAKAWGARVITTAGSDLKCKACERLGADLVINYHNQDFVSEVKSFTSKLGVDVILDMIGGDYVERNLAAAAVEGRILNIAFQKGSQVNLDLMKLMLKRITLTGSTLRVRSSAYKAEIANQLHRYIWPLIDTGRIRPQVYKVLPLSEVAQAHRLLESGEVIGKLVLSVNAHRNG